MNHSASPLPIVVGVDGSKHGVRAAMWAIDEAVSRDTPLRLVHVVNARSADPDRDYAYARDVLHKAWDAVEATGQPVKLESDIQRGDPLDELVKLSRTAAMMCVGSRGTNNSPCHRRGSTAAELAQRAHSPVGIVRRRHTHKPPPAGQWIIAALDESPGSHAVLQTALHEAQLRQGSVLALTPWPTVTVDAGPPGDEPGLVMKLKRYLNDAQDDNADVEVCTLPMPTDMSNLLAQSASIDQLVVVGPSDPDLITQVVGPKARAILHKTNCSLLILRDRR